MYQRESEAIFCTVSASNWRLLDQLPPNIKEVVFLQQNDQAGKYPAASNWLARSLEILSASPIVRGVRVVNPPPQIKDWNDWTLSKPAALRILGSIEKASEQTVGGASEVEVTETKDEDEALPEIESPDFPTQRLPPVLRSKALGVSESLNVHINLTGITALAVTSAALGKGVYLQWRTNQQTRANLYIIGGGVSGSGKTEGSRPLVLPIRQYAADQRSRFQQDTLPRLKAEKYRLTRQLTVLAGRLAKKPAMGELADKEKLCAEHDKGFVRLEELEELLIEPAVMVEDVTPQKLGVLLASSGEQLFSFSTEASNVIANIQGRYNPLGKPDENLYICAFSGDSCDADRIGRSAVHLESPCMSLLWLPQPDLVNQLLANKRLREGGFLQRLLIANTKLKPIEIPPDCPAIPLQIQQDYNNLINSLISAYRQSPVPFQIPANPEALELVRRYHNELVSRRNGDLADLNSYAARWHEQGLRVANVLHCAIHGNQAHLSQLLPETVNDALGIVDWFNQHQLALLSRSRHAAHRIRLEELITLLREKGVMTVRDLDRRHGFKAAELRELCEMFPAKIQSIETKDPKGGRPSPKIKLRR